jgi:hypothetical protein
MWGVAGVQGGGSWRGGHGHSLARSFPLQCPSHLPQGPIQLAQDAVFIKHLALVAVLIVVMDLLAEVSRQLVEGHVLLHLLVLQWEEPGQQLLRKRFQPHPGTVALPGLEWAAHPVQHQIRVFIFKPKYTLSKNSSVKLILDILQSISNNILNSDSKILTLKCRQVKFMQS